MAGSKKYLAIGLALALAVPTTVFAQEATIEEKEKFVVKNEKILDKNANEVGMIQFTADVDPATSFAQKFELTATVYKKEGEELVPYDGLSYTWVDPNAEEGDETVKNLPAYTINDNGTYTVQVDLNNVTTTWELDEKVLNFSVDILCIDITAPSILNVTQTPTEWTKDKVVITVEAADYQPELDNTNDTSNDTSSEKVTGIGLHDMPYSFDGGVTWSNTNRTTVQENKTLNIIVRDALGNQASKTVEVKNIDKTAPTVSLSATDEKNADGYYILTATASDAESDLAELAYSWNNGETWNPGPSAKIDTEGTYAVIVRDKVGNTAKASVTIAKNSTGTEEGPGTDSGTTGGDSSTGSGTTGSGSSTGSGTTGGGSSTGSGTTGGSSSTGSGTTGSGSSTGSGTTGGSSSTGSGITGGGSGAGTSEWEDNNHVSGVVDTNKETKETEETETETDETAETETETLETKETKETKETETKAGIVTPGKDKDNGFKFPIGLALIIAAILIVLSIIILVIKMIIDRHAEAAAEADEEEEDMSKVYARVNREETKVIDAAAAAAAAATAKAVEENKAAEDVKPEATVPFEDMEIEEAIGAAVTAAIAADEPVVKKIQRKHDVTPEAAPEAAPEVNPEDEISIGEFAAAAVAAGVAVVENEKEMEAAISEMEEEKAAVAAGAANPAEAVVIEGAHSRLIIDPETGEYTYEFK